MLRSGEEGGAGGGAGVNENQAIPRREEPLIGMESPEGVSDKDYATASGVVMIIYCHIHRLQ